jgi:hypothetical protein
MKTRAMPALHSAPVKKNRSITLKHKLEFNSLLQNNKPSFHPIVAKMAIKSLEN